MWAVRGDWQTWVVWYFARKSLHESCRIGRHIIVMKPIRSLRHCECDLHRVHKLSQQCLTADWLAPWESDCSRMRSKVSSDRLPSCIKAKRPILEIFKADRYRPDRLNNNHLIILVLCSLIVVIWHVSWLYLNAVMSLVQKVHSCPSVLHVNYEAGRNKCTQADPLCGNAV